MLWIFLFRIHARSASTPVLEYKSSTARMHINTSTIPVKRAIFQHFYSESEYAGTAITAMASLKHELRERLRRMIRAQVSVVLLDHLHARTTELRNRQ